MGGYGGSSGRTKDRAYYDTGGHKVKDANAIEVAEHYIKDGKYVAFLQEKDGQRRADLSVDGQHVEVKGLSSLNPDTVESRLKHAFTQVDADRNQYPEDSRRDGKVVLLSRHPSNITEQKIYDTMLSGFRSAKHKGYITGKVEVWIHGKIFYLN